MNKKIFIMGLSYTVIFWLSYVITAVILQWGQGIGRILAEISTGRFPTEAWTMLVSFLFSLVFGPFLFSEVMEIKIQDFQVEHLISGIILMVVVAWGGWFVLMIISMFVVAFSSQLSRFWGDVVKAYYNR